MNDLSVQAIRMEDVGGHYDRWLIGAALALGSIGLVMVASASVALAGDTTYYLKRHVMHLALGVGLAIVAMRLDLRTVEKYNKWLLVGCFVLLILVMLPGLGHSVNGARRWVRIPGLGVFQMVEAVKVLYIVWLSSYLVRFSDEVNATWPAMLKPVGVVLSLITILMMQPDFGSSMLLLGITGGMLVLGGAQIKRMLLPILLLLPVLAGLIILEPYRMRRVTSFMDPWADQLGAGYQLSNALMAIGRGEWTGVGLGASIQKLNYLPEAHTDFIFSVLAEELGFAGVCTVIALLTLLIGRGLWLGYQCVQQKRHFSGYIAFGISLWLGMQAFISMGVNLGMLPTKGLTLPLISSGGSSVMMTCAAIGVLLRVSWEYARAERRQSWRHAGVTLEPAREESGRADFHSGQTQQAPRHTATDVASFLQASLRRDTRGKTRVEPTFGDSP